jgi:acyl transferase domain-containing protein/NADPH:quinone reductase-like Zn-dependent oxidoreductase
VPFRDAGDLRAQLAAIAAGEGRAGARTVVEAGTDPVFVLSGMGPQWWRMGRDLLQAGGAFAETARAIDEIFTRLAGWSIVAELGRDEADSRVMRTEVAQPANFLVQVALCAELQRYGVRPSAIVGHSVGEVSAAYLSGALTLEEAVTVSYHRSRLQATTAGTGAMLAVGLPEVDALAWIADTPDVCVAAVNSPSAVTLAGDRPTLDVLRQRLVDAGVFARELRVEVPYHSHLMDPILPELVEQLAGLAPRVPSVPLVSTVTGATVREAAWGARYWADNVRLPVRFADAIGTLVDAGHRVFLEVGPHPVLSGNIREILVRGGETGVSVPTLTRDGDDEASLRQALAELYVAGALDERRAPGGDAGPAPWADLPRHPFQRVHLWTQDPSILREHLGVDGSRPLPGDRTPATAPEWETSLGEAGFPWLRDHVVAGLVLLPGAAYLDAALAAASELTGRERPALENVRFVAPLVVGLHEAPVVRVSADETTGRFAVRSRPADGDVWTLHATGRLVDAQVEPTLLPVDGGSGRVMAGDDLYAALDARGLSYGPAFRRIRSARVCDGAVVATVDASIAAGSRHLAHPAVVDAALQCVAALVTSAEAGDGAVVPASVRAVRLLRPIPEEVTVTVARRPAADLTADVTLSDAAGEPVLELQEVVFLPVAPAPPALTELGPLWYEPVFEPRAPRDVSAARELAAAERMLVVALGERARPWAGALADRRPGSVVVTVDGDDPEAVAERLRPALREMLVGRASPVLVAVSSILGTADGSVTAGPDPDGASIGATADDVAGLAGTARAVQTVLDEMVLSGQEDDQVAYPVNGVALLSGALAVPGDQGGADVLAAALLGARRTLRNEQPSLHWRCVDAEPGTPLELVEAELATGGPFAEDDADEVALRDGVRMVMRARSTLDAYVAPRQEARPALPEESWRIEIPASGLLSELGLRAVDRVAPGPGEVELRIEGLGLNYKHGLKVLGILGERELAGTYYGTGLGMEALAVVTRVGPGVTAHAVGDRRFVGARDMGRRYLTVSTTEAQIEPLPRGWGIAELPSFVPFVTAHYGLKRLARVRPGETVLVHGAASGVGLAAVQVAKHAGATVIASAGSPERRAVAAAAGADHTVNSRSLAFVDEVLELTGGRGADVVISSAPGEVVNANLRVAAEFGRVVEVGKSEIYGGRVLELAPFDKNLAFMALDLDRMYLHRVDLFMELLRETFQLFDDGAYTPLPSSVFDVAHLAEAFDAVLRSAHAGRVVLDLTMPEPLARPAVPVTAVRADATYLITGGLGTFGLATARWLAGRGARHLVLAGRRGVTTDAQREQFSRLEAAGVQVVIEQLDITELADVGVLLDRLAATLPPLRGVFHAAGVLADQAFTELTASALHQVVDPKAVGAWNLHRALLDREVPLDHFVLYSSVTAIAGTVPQINYAAANSVLDGLAHYRRARGLPALSVNWGVLSGGMASSSDDVVRYLAMLGLRAMDIDRACAHLDETLAIGVPQVTILDIDWARWGAMHPASADAPRFAEHVRAGGAGDSAAAVLRAELAAMAADQRAEVLTYILAEQLAAVLGIPAETVDVGAPLPDLGPDSLMAVELSARVNVALDLEISALEFSRGGGLSALGVRLADHLEGTASAPSPGGPPPTAGSAPSPGDAGLAGEVATR